MPDAAWLPTRGEIVKETTNKDTDNSTVVFFFQTQSYTEGTAKELTGEL